MGEKDDGLGLSLRLGNGESEISLKLNLMSTPSKFIQNHHQKNSWKENLSSSERNIETTSFWRGIDVNQTPTVINCDEENGISSPNNSTISSISGKRNEREPAGEETEAERTSCSRGSDDDDNGGGNGARKKLRLSKEQSIVLEEMFKEHSTLNPKQKLALSKQLNLRPRQVEVWFQNRRARTKLKQTEVDCEHLKRNCENLSEENRRLHKEVQELRALKPSSQFYMQMMNPPTTFSMCPSCERVAVSSTLLPASAPSQHPTGSISPWATMAAARKRFNA